MEEVKPNSKKWKSTPKQHLVIFKSKERLRGNRCLAQKNHISMSKSFENHVNEWSMQCGKKSACLKRQASASCCIQSCQLQYMFLLLHLFKCFFFFSFLFKFLFTSIKLKEKCRDYPGADWLRNVLVPAILQLCFNFSWPLPNMLFTAVPLSGSLLDSNTS